MHTLLSTRAIAAYLCLSVCSSIQAAGYNPVTQQAQTALAAQGFDPGVLDGMLGPNTNAAIKTFQQKNGLSATAMLDAATLDKLGIGVATDKVHAIADWRALPAQSDIDALVANPPNNPASPYTDYRPNAPGANLDIPGAAILAAMNLSADVFGSRRAGQPKHTAQGYKYMSECLKTGYAPTHWSDLTLHYYCQMSKPRACYTYATSGKSTGGVKVPRTQAYLGCAAGRLASAGDFAWVVKNQPLVFQYVMFGQTHAFNHEQEQAVINAFYGVNNPDDTRECLAKRPRRTEDPQDGTHCRVNKTMSRTLVGRGI